jgi:hypothetical protein
MKPKEFRQQRRARLLALISNATSQLEQAHKSLSRAIAIAEFTEWTKGVPGEPEKVINTLQMVARYMNRAQAKLSHDKAIAKIDKVLDTTTEG